MKREALRVSTTIPAAPTTLYLAWLSSEQHGAMTGSPAKIDPTVGSKYSTWNGYISGKLVTLDLGRRVVMSWRTTDFPREAPDSRVEIHFEALGDSTRLTILHTDIPEGQGEKYRVGWNDSYFSPMRSFFSKYLPDPRKPPPPRRPIPPEDDDPDEDPVPKKGSKGAKVLPTSKKEAVAPPAKGKPAIVAKAAPPPPKTKAPPPTAKAPPPKAKAPPPKAKAPPPKAKAPPPKAAAAKAPTKKGKAAPAKAAKPPVAKKPPTKKASGKGKK